jgi:FkbM family methyltransferase
MFFLTASTGEPCADVSDIMRRMSGRPPDGPAVYNCVTSAILRRYLLGPEHPMKLRFWGYLRRWTRYARLQLPYLENGWITIDERDYVQSEILRRGAYEPEVWDALASHAEESEIVWDVGAHIGSFAIRAAQDNRVKSVHCFEPNAELTPVLSLNLSLNRGHYVCHSWALSSRRGVHSFFAGPASNIGLGTLSQEPEDWKCNKLALDCRTADEIIAEGQAPPPSLLKIDVEGWEEHVLQGAAHLLAATPPKAIVFEADPAVDGMPQNRGLTELIQRCGYRVDWIRRPSGEINVRENYLASRSAT